MAMALISPNEPRTVGDKVGARVAQVEAAEFIVAPPLYWVTCNNSIVADQYAYIENKFVKIPEIALELLLADTPPPETVIDIVREF